MTGKEVMKYAMNEKHVTQQEVASRAGYIRQSNVSEILRSDNARVDNLVKVLNACGYDLVVIDRNDQDKKIVIDLGGAARE